MNTTTNHLSSLPTTEAHLVNAIDATTAAIEGIATNAVDSALARLELAVRGAHARIGVAACQMREKVAEIVATMEAVATEVFEQMSAEDQVGRIGIGTAHTAHRSGATEGHLALEPSRQTEPVAPAATIEPTAATIELAERPADDEMFHLTAEPQENAQEARGEEPKSEATRSASTNRIEPPNAADARGEAVAVPSIAACSLVEEPEREANQPAPAVTTRRKKARRGRT